MTVAELCDKLQNIAHAGNALKEVKNIEDIVLEEDGVYIIPKKEMDIENPPGLWQC
jgi:hypothetical protein